MAVFTGYDAGGTAGFSYDEAGNLVAVTDETVAVYLVDGERVNAPYRALGASLNALGNTVTLVCAEAFDGRAPLLIDGELIEVEVAGGEASLVLEGNGISVTVETLDGAGVEVAL